MAQAFLTPKRRNETSVLQSHFRFHIFHIDHFWLYRTYFTCFKHPLVVLQQSSESQSLSVKSFLRRKGPSSFNLFQKVARIDTSLNLSHIPIPEFKLLSKSPLCPVFTRLTEMMAGAGMAQW